MKTLIKGILLGIFINLTIVGCGILKKPQQEQTAIFGSSMYGQVMVLNERGLDSLCVVDNLPKNLNEWKSSSYRDYETNKMIVKKMYIKEIGKQQEIIYIMLPMEDEYKVTKRVVKE